MGYLSQFTNMVRLETEAFSLTGSRHDAGLPNTTLWDTLGLRLADGPTMHGALARHGDNSRWPVPRRAVATAGCMDEGPIARGGRPPRTS